jgi:hypothetical protein
VGANDDRLGFELCIPARALGRGRHTLHLGALDHDGRPLGTPVDVTVDVAAEQRPFPYGAEERAGTPRAACRLSADPRDGADEIAVVLGGLQANDGHAFAVPRGTTVGVSGWALGAGGSAATDVYLELRPPEPAVAAHRYGAVAGFRRDVPPRGVPAPPVGDAWFACSFGTDSVSPGTYRLDLVVAESGRRAVIRRALGYVNVAARARTV